MEATTRRPAINRPATPEHKTRSDVDDRKATRNGQRFVPKRNSGQSWGCENTWRHTRAAPPPKSPPQRQSTPANQSDNLNLPRCGRPTGEVREEQWRWVLLSKRPTRMSPRPTATNPNGSDGHVL